MQNESQMYGLNDLSIKLSTFAAFILEFIYCSISDLIGKGVKHFLCFVYHLSLKASISEIFDGGTLKCIGAVFQFALVLLKKLLV